MCCFGNITSVAIVNRWDVGWKGVAFQELYIAKCGMLDDPRIHPVDPANELPKQCSLRRTCICCAMSRAAHPRMRAADLRK
jgi:hypothetical protein